MVGKRDGLDAEMRESESPDPGLAEARGARLDVTALGAAVGLLTILPFEAPNVKNTRFGRATLFFPLIGFLLGLVLVGLNRLLQDVLPAVPLALLLIACWEVLSGANLRGAAAGAAVAVFGAHGKQSAAAWVLMAAVLFVKAAFLAAQPVTRSAALLFAPLLGRWSMVVLAHGARDAEAPGQKFSQAISFHEFAWSSVFTLAVVLSLAEAIGVLVIVCVASAAVALRLMLHRRVGGVSWDLLLAAAEVIEMLVVALFAVW